METVHEKCQTVTRDDAFDSWEWFILSARIHHLQSNNAQLAGGQMVLFLTFSFNILCPFLTFYPVSLGHLYFLPREKLIYFLSLSLSLSSQWLNWMHQMHLHPTRHSCAFVRKFFLFFFFYPLFQCTSLIKPIISCIQVTVHLMLFLWAKINLRVINNSLTLDVTNDSSCISLFFFILTSDHASDSAEFSSSLSFSIECTVSWKNFNVRLLHPLMQLWVFDLQIVGKYFSSLPKVKLLSAQWTIKFIHFLTIISVAREAI